MAWQERNIDWEPSNILTAADLNRIEENEKYLYDTKLDKTATAIDSAKLGGLSPSSYLQSVPGASQSTFGGIKISITGTAPNITLNIITGG